MRDGLTYFDQAYAFTGNEMTAESVRSVLGIPPVELFFSLIQSIENHDIKGCFRMVDDAVKIGIEFIPLLDGFGKFLRNLLYARLDAFTPDALNITEELYTKYKYTTLAATQKTGYYNVVPGYVNVSGGLYTYTVIYRINNRSKMDDDAKKVVLDNMIDAGKRLMFTQTMFPSTTQEDLLGSSKEQYKWAKDNESAVWHYLIERNMVYDNSDDVIRRMIDETPFTRDFGNTSPGRLGWYIGFQIVQSYMKNHPGTTLKDLLSMTDSQKFLKESGYKPN